MCSFLADTLPSPAEAVKQGLELGLPLAGTAFAAATGWSRHHKSRRKWTRLRLGGPQFTDIATHSGPNSFGDRWPPIVRGKSSRARRDKGFFQDGHPEQWRFGEGAGFLRLSMTCDRARALWRLPAGRRETGAIKADFSTPTFAATMQLIDHLPAGADGRAS